MYYSTVVGAPTSDKTEKVLYLRKEQKHKLFWQERVAMELIQKYLNSKDF